jgi:ferrous iron transport protein A
MVGLNDLKPGEQAKLIEFGKSNPVFRRRLQALGLTRGAKFTVIRFAPLGCPVELLVRGSYLSLRKNEAKHLVMERL